MNEWKPRRFWKEALVADVHGGFGVALDGRPALTPGKAPLTMPTAALAEEVAREWAAQGELLDYHAMPLTRAVNAAVDGVAPRREAVVAEIAEYADSDLTCYRAEGPLELVERQSRAWDPLLGWADETCGARLRPVRGVVHAPQPRRSLDRLRAEVAALPPFELAGLSELVTLSGSLIIGLAAVEGFLPPGELWARSRIDELWQEEKWGRDEEAVRAAESREIAFLQAARFCELARKR